MTSHATPTDRPFRVGLVTPSANPSFENEVIDLLPLGMAAHTARLPEHIGLDLRARLESYVDDLPDTVRGFGALPLRRVFVGCTGSSYGLGPGGDARWSAEASAITGVPVTTAAGAVKSLLTALSRTRLLLVSPYPEWLTAMCVEHWKNEGFSVAAADRLRGEVSVYERSPADVHEAVTHVAAGYPEDDGRTAVVVTGTGVRSLCALDAAVWRTGLPLLSSNVAVAWAAANAAGLGDALSQSSSAALRRLHTLTRKGRT
ncbi:hypothetical protein [Nocardiopsis sp. ATB16-24]|uniref:aspartate racemase/maleate isomerase family protein n=1 Tax=Nocardiopsis sp. ATB16-24 TaxID=3019555 RepID=UPI0025531E97|nr:hypothetical protein [Nocardiopsis sp. ATB16-24]